MRAVKENSVFKKLLIGYSPRNPNYKLTTARKNTLGSLHSRHTNPHYIVTRVNLLSVFVCSQRGLENLYHFSSHET